MNALDRPLPHDLDAERACLGAMLQGGRDEATRYEPLETGMAILGSDPQVFHVPHNQVVYAALLAIYRQKEPLDGVFLRAWIEGEQPDAWERMGKFDYLAGLMQSVPSSLRVEHYAQRMMRVRLRRELIGYAHEVSERAFDPQVKADEQVALADHNLRELAQRGTRQPAMSFADLLDQVCADLDGPAECGVTTGLAELDGLIDALYGDDLILVAGRVSQGKTTFLLTVCEHLAEQAQRVLLFSVEMPRRQLAQRIIGSRIDVPMRAFRRHDLSPSQRERLNAEYAALRRSGLMIDDTSPLRVEDLCARARSLHRTKPLALIAVDYLQKLGCARRMEKRYLEVGYVAGTLKDLAKDLHVPVLAASQIRRVEGRKPTLDDLRESGDQEQHADVVVLVWQEPDAEPERRQMIVAKQRNGPTGEFNVRFDLRRMQFGSWVPGRDSAEAQEKEYEMPPAEAAKIEAATLF